MARCLVPIKPNQDLIKLQFHNLELEEAFEYVYGQLVSKQEGQCIYMLVNCSAEEVEGYAKQAKDVEFFVN